MAEHYKNHGCFITQIQDKLIKQISNAYDAAVHMLLGGADNALECHIDNALAQNTNFLIWRQWMPSRTSK